MIARTPVVNAISNLKMIQNSLDSTYVIWQCNIFKIENALVYHALSKILMDTDLYVYVKQKNSTHDDQAAYFMVMQATEIKSEAAELTPR